MSNNEGDEDWSSERNRKWVAHEKQVSGAEDGYNRVRGSNDDFIKT